MLAGIRARWTRANVVGNTALFGALAAVCLLMLPAQALGGASPDIEVMPLDLSFGSAPVGATDDPLNVQVENGEGLADLTVSAPSITGPSAGDYSISSDSCAPYPSFLNGGEICTIEVTFQPAAIGARNATLNIPNNAGQPTVEVSLTGEGEFPANHDAYYPSGPQAFVDKGKLDGWELCFSGATTPPRASTPSSRNATAIRSAGRRPDRQLDAHRPRDGTEG